jgi:transposase-like protein
MIKVLREPRTLQEAILYFSDPKRCHDFLTAARWPDGEVRCPYCGSAAVKFMPKYLRWYCGGDHDRKQFSIKVGSIFEDSPLPLAKWLPAVWLIVNCKNGISSYELHRALKVTQKTAWFMLQRIRLAMETNTFEKMGGGGPVEADETFIGGKARFMHKHKRAQKIKGTGGMGKALVVGLLVVAHEEAPFSGRQPRSRGSETDLGIGRSSRLATARAFRSACLRSDGNGNGQRSLFPGVESIGPALDEQLSA